MIHTSQTSQFMFRNALWRHAAKTALVVGGRSYTYRELDSLSSTLAAGLACEGLKPVLARTASYQCGAHTPSAGCGPAGQCSMAGSQGWKSFAARLQSALVEMSRRKD